jgi:hypothetical protein
MSEMPQFPRMVNDSREPDLVARARQTPSSPGWMTIGLAWSVADEAGNHGYAVRLHAVPTAWDGNFFLMPPTAE